jgi:hypothetical protein
LTVLGKELPKEDDLPERKNKYRRFFKRRYADGIIDNEEQEELEDKQKERKLTDKQVSEIQTEVRQEKAVALALAEEERKAVVLALAETKRKEEEKETEKRNAALAEEKLRLESEKTIILDNSHTELDEEQIINHNLSFLRVGILTKSEFVSKLKNWYHFTDEQITKILKAEKELQRKVTLSPKGENTVLAKAQNIPSKYIKTGLGIGIVTLLIVTAVFYWHTKNDNGAKIKIIDEIYAITKKSPRDLTKKYEIATVRKQILAFVFTKSCDYSNIIVEMTLSELEQLEALKKNLEMYKVCVAEIQRKTDEKNKELKEICGIINLDTNNIKINKTSNNLAD